MYLLFTPGRLNYCEEITYWLAVFRIAGNSSKMVCNTCLLLEIHPSLHFIIFTIIKQSPAVSILHIYFLTAYMKPEYNVWMVVFTLVDFLRRYYVYVISMYFPVLFYRLDILYHNLRWQEFYKKIVSFQAPVGFLITCLSIHLYT